MEDGTLYKMSTKGEERQRKEKGCRCYVGIVNMALHQSTFGGGALTRSLPIHDEARKVMTEG